MGKRLDRALKVYGKRLIGGFRTRGFGYGSPGTFQTGKPGGRPFNDILGPLFVPAPSGSGHDMEKMGQRQRDRRQFFKRAKNAGLHLATVKKHARARAAAQEVLMREGISAEVSK